jgi:hypothetical protein
VNGGKKQPRPHPWQQLIGQRHAHAHNLRACLRICPAHGMVSRLPRFGGQLGWDDAVLTVAMLEVIPLSGAETTCNVTMPANTSSNPPHQ